MFVLRDNAEGCNKQHDYPAGEIQDTSAGLNGTMTPTHATHTHDSGTNVSDGESRVVHTQQVLKSYVTVQRMRNQWTQSNG